MKLRTKTILFFGTSFLLVSIAVVCYGWYVVGNTFKSQTVRDVRIFAEQNEGAYFAFLEKVKTRTLDWSSDPFIQSAAKDIIRSKKGTASRELFARDFANYIATKKMPYDKMVTSVDLLDKSGEVVASTDSARLGKNEHEEELIHKTTFFSKAITANFGEAFVRGIVFEEDEGVDPVTHATARLFTKDNTGKFIPLDAVLLLHFSSINQIADTLNGASQIRSGALTGDAFSSSYTTSDIYFVNSDRFMVTPSRYVKDLKAKQEVDTLPVQECFGSGKEVTSEYVDYRGVSVLGASMCFPSENLVLLVEIERDEIFAPFIALMYESTIGGLILLVVGGLAVLLFVRVPLRRVDEMIAALERIMRGDFSVRVKVDSDDETGRLAAMFNTMVDSIRKSQEDLEESRRLVEEKAVLLQKDLGEHEKQEKFLEESKRATLNLLEDSWKAKEKLEEEGNKLQTIIASIGDSLVLIDMNYKIILVNAKTLEDFGVPQEEIVGKDLRDVVKLYKKKVYVDPREWPTEEVFRANKAVTSTLEDDYYVLTKGSEEKTPVTLSIAPISGRFSGAVIIVRDVTSDHALDEAKSSFISVASHQLRTPLTSIRWYSEMLLSEDAGALNASQKDFLNEIHGGAERLYKTVDLLLGISRVENGKIKINRNVVDLTVFTSEIVKELLPQINEKKLEIKVPSPGEGSVAVWVDPLILRQVVLNIVSNAIRYTLPHGVVEITWKATEDGKDVIYAVRDNGIGIPEHQKNRIFSKFFRAENARNQVPDGSGLGLSLVKDLTESWGGKVWFESKENEGSTFFFTVPIVETSVS